MLKPIPMSQAPSPELPPPVEAIVASVDPRLVETVRRAVLESLASPAEILNLGRRVVLVGHRAAGKSRLLPHVAQLLGRPAVDLDAALERDQGRSLREWVATNEAEFRQAERHFFQSRPDDEVQAAGGGFLSHHGDLLAPHLAVLVPVTFQTYRDRLLQDTTRPRLRPQLPLEQELEELYRERETLHAQVHTVSLSRFLAEVVRQGKGR
jgi:shikimate kinase